MALFKSFSFLVIQNPKCNYTQLQNMLSNLAGFSIKNNQLN
jgi:hypothetical protein